jgi:hypothetical protein
MAVEQVEFLVHALERRGGSCEGFDIAELQPRRKVWPLLCRWLEMLISALMFLVLITVLELKNDIHSRVV